MMYQIFGIAYGADAVTPADQGEAATSDRPQTLMSGTEPSTTTAVQPADTGAQTAPITSNSYGVLVAIVLVCVLLLAITFVRLHKHLMRHHIHLRHDHKRVK